MNSVRKDYVEMRTITANRADMLEKVRKNKETHISEYKEAMEAYKKELASKINEAMSRLAVYQKQVEDGTCLKIDWPAYALRKPESHEKDYAQVIMMLEMEINDTIEVKSDEFACYVMDDWDWKKDWDNTKAFYGMS